MSDRPTVFMLVDNPMRSDLRVEREARSLHAHGWKVRLFAMEDPALPEQELRDHGLVERSVPRAIISPLSLKYLRARARFARMLVAEGARCIHAHDHYCLDLAVAAKRLDPTIKIIYDAHEYLAGWPVHKESPRRADRLKGAVVWWWCVQRERMNLRHCASIITVSRSLCDEMQRRYGLAKRPALLRNIPDVPSTVPDIDLRHDLRIPAHLQVLVHSGNVYHSDARIAMLLRGCLSVDGTYLLFICNVKNRAKVTSVIEGERIMTDDRVGFVDFPERHEVLLGMLRKCDAGVVHTWQPDWPSHWYSLPNRIMEYTLCGLPVLATSQPEFAAFHQEFGNCSLYNGERVHELRAAIERLREQRSQLEARAKHASSRLSWALEQKALIDLYEEHCGAVSGMGPAH
jgi:glycosyltransferase involved in cell wall biosynthesis